MSTRRKLGCKQTHRMIHCPYPWSCSVRWCLAEGLASGDQCLYTGSGSALEACSPRCAIPIHVYFTLRGVYSDTTELNSGLKGPFIATQLNSSRVELSCVGEVSIAATATQLNSTQLDVELSTRSQRKLNAVQLSQLSCVAINTPFFSSLLTQTCERWSTACGRLLERVEAKRQL